MDELQPFVVMRQERRNWLLLGTVGMVLEVATLSTLVGISHSLTQPLQAKKKTTSHDGKVKRKPQTDNFGPQKTTVKPLWKMKRPI